MRKWKSILDESRIVSPNEKLVIDGKLFRPGDIISHYKFGIGQIDSIDLKTYSIPMITFIPNNMNDKIYRATSEFKQLTGEQLRQLHNR